MQHLRWKIGKRLQRNWAIFPMGLPAALYGIPRTRRLYPVCSNLAHLRAKFSPACKWSGLFLFPLESPSLQMFYYRLRRYRLLGLSQLDQIYLQGIVELLSSTQMEVTERLSGLQIKVRPSLSTFQGSCDSGQCYGMISSSQSHHVRMKSFLFVFQGFSSTIVG